MGFNLSCCATLSQGYYNLVITMLVQTNLVTTLSPPYMFYHNLVTTLFIVNNLVTILLQACTTLSFYMGMQCMSLRLYFKDTGSFRCLCSNRLFKLNIHTYIHSCKLFIHVLCCRLTYLQEQLAMLNQQLHQLQEYQQYANTAEEVQCICTYIRTQTMDFLSSNTV